jgi:hypothetical protein
VISALAVSFLSPVSGRSGGRALALSVCRRLDHDPNQTRVARSGEERGELVRLAACLALQPDQLVVDIRRVVAA